MKISLFREKYIAVLVMACAVVTPFLYGDDYYFESRELSFLTAPSVTCITEDEYGILWIGTPSGIIVYDGRNVENYNRSSLPALPADDILSLEYVETSDEIWIGTVAGLVRYNLKNEKVRPVSVRFLDDQNSSHEFLRIESNAEGTIFAMTRDGLFVSESGERLEEVEVEVPIDGSAGYFDLDIGGNGVVWAVANDGLKSWDPETGKFLHIANIPASGCVTAIGDSVWIGTVGFGVYRYQVDSHNIEEFRIAGEAASLIAGPEGNIWVGTEYDGITVIDPVSGIITPVEIDPEHPYRLPSGRITTLMNGRDGHIWIGTGDAGFLSVDVRKTNHLSHVRRSGPSGLSGGTVSVLLEDSLGYLWAGSDIGGISRFDPELGTTRHYDHSLDDLFSIPGDKITSIIEDSTGRIWVGTDKGPVIYLPEVDGFEPPGGMMGGWPDFQNMYVLAMVESSDGSIWISFRSGDIYKLNSMDRNYRTYRYLPPSTVPSVFVADRYGSVWAGSRQGLRLYNEEGFLVKTWPTTGCEDDGIPEGGVSALFVDSSDQLWLGGPTGLAVYKGVDEGFSLIELKNGDSMSVTGIIEDGARNLWIVDGREVHLFSTDGEYLATIGGDSGLTPSGLISEISIGNAGIIRLGSNNEIWSYDGFVQAPVCQAPQAYLTVLKVFDKKVANGRELGQKRLLSLPSTDNMFSIGFGAVDHRYLSRIGYQYKLLGFHNEWLDSGKNDSVMYAKLPPGSYDFVLRAYNDSGVFSDEISLGIKVEPSFWRTPLAIGLYVIFLASFIVIIVKLREGQLLKTQVKELEEARKKVLEANRKLEFLTMNDSLTGLLNRRGFDQAIDHALTTANRNNLMITLFMMDVDFFKAYNDHYGHVNGDEVLRGMGKALRAVFERSTDIIARYGGEEFAVLFIGDNPNASVTLANDLILAVESLGIKHEYSSVSELLTMSIGSATIKALVDVSIESLVKTADKALYAAKGGGRNRTCFTGILPALPETMKNGIEPMILEAEPAQ